MLLLLVAGEALGFGSHPLLIDPVCEAEYAPKCPVGWLYSAARSGTCIKPANSTSHCASPTLVDTWSAAKKQTWEGLCSDGGQADWPTAKCPTGWSYSAASSGTCTKSGSRCSPAQRTCCRRGACACSPPCIPALRMAGCCKTTFAQRRRPQRCRAPRTTVVRVGMRAGAVGLCVLPWAGKGACEPAGGPDGQSESKTDKI